MKSLSKLSFFFILFFLISCNSTKKSTQVNNEELSIASHSWLLDTWTQDDKIIELQTMEAIQLSFNDSTKSINGSDGCNSFFANYTTDQNKLLINAGGATKKYCGEESARDEQAFMKFLQSAPNYKIENTKLELETSTEKLIFNPKN